MAPIPIFPIPLKGGASNVKKDSARGTGHFSLVAMLLMSFFPFIIRAFPHSAPL
jgi:hypothetical protein